MVSRCLRNQIYSGDLCGMDVDPSVRIYALSECAYAIRVLLNGAESLEIDIMIRRRLADGGSSTIETANESRRLASVADELDHDPCPLFPSSLE